jgi:hypothetical protein
MIEVPTQFPHNFFLLGTALLNFYPAPGAHCAPYQALVGMSGNKKTLPDLRGFV